jgi:8-oxo-dGTP pyrophosphatase MutT (NUDIX family)
MEVSEQRTTPSDDAINEAIHGQTPNLGTPTIPRDASTVILLREGPGAIETLLVLRSPEAKFMASVWVFPGGGVDRTEIGAADAHRRAAVRELQEEAGVTLTSEEALIELSRWITPAEVTIRYDTRFFLAELPVGQEARVDGGECVDFRWIAPTAALEAHAAGEMTLVLPTIKHLEFLTRYRSVVELFDDVESFDVSPVEPRVVLHDGVPRVLLPGDPGY